MPTNKTTIYIRSNLRIKKQCNRSDNYKTVLQFDDKRSLIAI